MKTSGSEPPRVGGNEDELCGWTLRGRLPSMVTKQATHRAAQMGVGPILPALDRIGQGPSIGVGPSRPEEAWGRLDAWSTMPQRDLRTVFDVLSTTLGTCALGAGDQ